jgi:hypothetical protein
MRLVRLSSSSCVNPDDVQDLTIKGSGYGDRIHVRMRNGDSFVVRPDYSKSAYETLDRLKTEIEGADAKE